MTERLVNPLKIGMFDSGIGGLSVLRVLLCQRPDLDIYYWADDAYAPYGSRSDAEIQERSQTITRAFIKMGIQTIVIACNTATAVAIDNLRATFPDVDFIGIEPYVNVVNHIPLASAHQAVILTTPLTGQSRRFSRLKNQLDPNHQLDHFSCPELARIVEQGFWNEDLELLPKIRQELAPLQAQNYSYVILGCTHYPLVGHYIQAVMNAQVISPCAAVAKRALEVLRLPAQKEPEYDVSFHFLRSSQALTYRKVSFHCDKNWPNL